MILFTYDFPHKKTLDFIFYCQHYGYKIDAIIAAPKVKLPIPNQKYKAGVDLNVGVIPTQELCTKLNIPYYVAPHNSKKGIEILKKYTPELGLIAGARILSSEVIECFSKGIINFHPGPIPEARGLDTAQWIVYDDLPLAVTSHFIDPRVDGGWIIKRLDMERTESDTLQDIGVRLYLGQLQIFKETMDMAGLKYKEDFDYVPLIAKASYKYFPPDFEETMMRRLNDND